MPDNVTLDPPITNIERLLARAAGMEGVSVDEPETRIERYLKSICDRLDNGGGLPEITGADDGKVLTANSGVWGASGDIVLNVTQDGYELNVTSDLPSMETVANTFKSGRNVVLVFANGDKCVLKPSQKETSYELDHYTFNGYVYDKEMRKYHAYVELYEDEGFTACHAYYIDADRFIVTLTPTALDYSGTMDKTVAEIDAAYKAGQEIWFKISSGESWTEYPLSRVGKESEGTYPSFNSNALYDELNMLVMIYTGTTSNGAKQTYSTKIYTLTPAT